MRGSDPDQTQLTIECDEDRRLSDGYTRTVQEEEQTREVGDQKRWHPSTLGNGRGGFAVEPTIGGRTQPMRLIGHAGIPEQGTQGPRLPSMGRGGRS